MKLRAAPIRSSSSLFFPPVAIIPPHSLIQRRTGLNSGAAGVEKTNGAMFASTMTHMNSDPKEPRLLFQEECPIGFRGLHDVAPIVQLDRMDCHPRPFAFEEQD
jgi:hypothetical protein